MENPTSIYPPRSLTFAATAMMACGYILLIVIFISLFLKYHSISVIATSALLMAPIYVYVYFWVRSAYSFKRGDSSGFKGLVAITLITALLVYLDFGFGPYFKFRPYTVPLLIIQILFLGYFLIIRKTMAKEQAAQSPVVNATNQVVIETNNFDTDKSLDRVLKFTLTISILFLLCISMPFPLGLIFGGYWVIALPLWIVGLFLLRRNKKLGLELAIISAIMCIFMFFQSVSHPTTKAAADFRGLSWAFSSWFMGFFAVCQILLSVYVYRKLKDRLV